MIFIDKSIKDNPEKRWNLSDEFFFAAGACHILAYAFLKRFPKRGFVSKWIKPLEGYKGNHIIVTDGKLIFDYQGYNEFDKYFLDLRKEMKGREIENEEFIGWDFTLEEFPVEYLISEVKSKEYGLWLRQPDQFLYNALPRAYKYIENFIFPE